LDIIFIDRCDLAVRRLSITAAAFEVDLARLGFLARVQKALA